MALGSGVASANADYWRSEGLLLEVSADPRDGMDHVQVNPQRTDRIELVALNARVDLRGITLHFSDGRTFRAHGRGVMPGQPVSIDLPPNCGVITSVDLEYIPADLRRTDRTPARLQIIPRGTMHAYRPQPSTWRQPTYAQPTYAQQSYQRPSWRYQPRPATTWSGRIEGRFSF